MYSLPEDLVVLSSDNKRLCWARVSDYVSAIEDLSENECTSFRALLVLFPLIKINKLRKNIEISLKNGPDIDAC